MAYADEIKEEGLVEKLVGVNRVAKVVKGCLLYTSDAADELLCVDLGGRRIIKKKRKISKII